MSTYAVEAQSTPLEAILHFRGVSEYLEYVVIRIDAPRLDSLYMRFFHQLIFDIPQLAQFVSRNTNAQLEGTRSGNKHPRVVI
jgi:hypothetical protein